MKQRQLLVIAAMLLIAAASVLGQTANRTRTITGTYTCIACEMQKAFAMHAQCDTFGHDYGVKLTDGTFIRFLRNDHSVDLVKGGGRTDFKITVTGLYDRGARTIDVQKYVIDGVETVWSLEKQKMERGATHKELLSDEKTPEKLTSK